MKFNIFFVIVFLLSAVAGWYVYSLSGYKTAGFFIFLIFIAVLDIVLSPVFFSKQEREEMRKRDERRYK